jgi:large subunit ribosomal protein L23
MNKSLIHSKVKKTPASSNNATDNWKKLLESNLNNIAEVIDLIKYPVITEKSYLALSKNTQYTFDVDLRLTKVQIKKLFENLFNVNVLSINTHIPPRQKRRMGGSQGYKPRYKRVILSLEEGQFLNYNISKSSSIPTGV